MTIQIIRRASLGMSPGTIRTLTDSVEAALVADGEAIYATVANRAGDDLAVRYDPTTGTILDPSGASLTGTTAQAAATAALVSKDGNFAEAVSNGGDAAFVNLLGSYLTVESNMPSSISGMKGQPYTNALNNSHCYVDAANGNDANSGYNPDAAKRTLNTANWTGATTSINPQMFTLLARGSDFTANHIIGNLGTGFSGGMSLASYGDPAKPKPIIRPTAASLYQNAGLSFLNPDGANLMDVVIDCAAMDSTAAVRNGVRFLTDTNSGVLRNVNISGVEIRPPRTQSGSWAAGLTVYKRTNDNSATAVARSGAVRIERCKVYNGGGHGILITGAMGYRLADGTWGGVEVLDCEVSRCGLDYDSHGITSYGDNAVKTTGVAWTNTTSTIYWCSYSTLAGRSVGDVELVNMLWTSNGISCTVHLEPNTATPTTPSSGEFGFDVSTQRLYVNLGGAVTTADMLMAATQPPRGILYAGNTVSDIPYLGLTSGFEGHGLTFDDWASDCVAFGNRSYRNGGYGLNTNKGSRNKFIRNYSKDARLGGIHLSGLGAIVEGNVIVGGSARELESGLICQDLINGPQGLITHIRRNLLVATSPVDAYIAQTDTAGFRGAYTVASGNQGAGLATLLTKGKVMGF
jgi:hypothetical protein